MTKIRSMLVDQSIMGGPERRGDERSEAPHSGGSPIIEPDAVPVPPDSEVPARHARRRFTTAYKLAILRRADACTRYGELGALLRKEGLYSSHVVTWRQQREAGLTPSSVSPLRARRPWLCVLIQVGECIQLDGQHLGGCDCGRRMPCSISRSMSLSSSMMRA